MVNDILFGTCDSYEKIRIATILSDPWSFQLRSCSSKLHSLFSSSYPRTLTPTRQLNHGEGCWWILYPRNECVSSRTVQFMKYWSSESEQAPATKNASELPPEAGTYTTSHQVGYIWGLYYRTSHGSHKVIIRSHRKTALDNFRPLLSHDVMARLGHPRRSASRSQLTAIQRKDLWRAWAVSVYLIGREDALIFPS